MDWTDSSDPAATQALLDDLARLQGKTCARCAHSLCGHEILFSIALGAKDAPRCLNCLAHALDRSPASLREQLTDHFQQRTCYSQAWQTACQQEHQPLSFRPACLERVATVHLAEPPGHPPSAVEKPFVPEIWDAGDMGCGDLVLALRIRLNALPPGGVLQVTARDPAAPLDLPAWCRLTGHVLVRADHPVYLIRRKEG